MKIGVIGMYKLTTQNKSEQEQEFKAQFLSVMGKIRRMRKYLKNESADSLLVMKDKLEELIIEKLDEEEAVIKQLEEKKQKVAGLRKIMADNNLSDADLFDPALMGDETVTNSKKKTKPPKYLFIDKDGQVFRWSGKGHKPAVFKGLLEAGISIDEHCMARDVEKRLQQNLTPHPGIPDIKYN